MPVYTVTLLAPNGNRVSRPIVACDADNAIAIMEADHDINPGDTRFQVTAEVVDDPCREMELSLLRMESRNREREMWERCR